MTLVIISDHTHTLKNEHSVSTFPYSTSHLFLYDFHGEILGSLQYHQLWINVFVLPFSRNLWKISLTKFSEIEQMYYSRRYNTNRL